MPYEILMNTMAHFEDMSEYEYFSDSQPLAKNVGWLQKGRDFKKMAPTERVLDVLWDYCTVSVEQTRGIHHCDLCEPPPRTVFAERNGQRMLLGTSEIRVFSREGEIYAAPTLIYHYVHTHHYSPPEIFLRALEESAKPPSPEYFEYLKNAGLEWGETSSPPFTQTAFRAEKVDGVVRVVEVPAAVYFDKS
jgi:hypothetical protein